MQARVLQKTRAYSRRKEKKRMLSTIEANIGVQGVQTR